MTVKMCAYPGCDQPCKPTTHRAFSLCESHSREYQRRYKSGNWDGWEKVERANKRKSDRLRSPKRTAAAPPAMPALPPPAYEGLRIIALRCTTCGIKYPYTDEHFDIGAQAETCRHCAVAPIVTIVDPLSSTARRARLLIADEPVSCGEGAEAYAAFARAEKAAGHHVVIQW